MFYVLVVAEKEMRQGYSRDMSSKNRSRSGKEGAFTIWHAIPLVSIEDGLFLRKVKHSVAWVTINSNLLWKAKLNYAR